MELRGNGIIITRTKREGTTAWWWISNEKQLPKTQSPTYIHRETIKAAGGRWSKKRREWYVIANDLPDRIRALVDEKAIPIPPQAEVVFIDNGKELSRRTVQELVMQGLASITWENGYQRTMKIGDCLFHSEGITNYREVRRLTQEDRQAAALKAAQAQVDRYLKWIAIVDKWQSRLGVLALPAPDENQPKVQVLASLDDPWS